MNPPCLRVLLTAVVIPSVVLGACRGHLSGGVASPGPGLPSSTATTVPSPCFLAAAERARVPALLAEGRLDRTVRVLERADGLCPTSAPETWEVLLAALLELGRDRDVQRVARILAARDNATAAARAFASLALATVAEREGQTFDDRATDRMQRVFAKALAARRNGRYAEAKRGFLEAWSTARPNGRALFFAGLVAKEMGDSPGAQRLFDRAIVELEDVTRKKLAVELTDTHLGGVRTIDWSRDGRFLAVGVNGVVSIRDSYLNLRETVRLEGHWGPWNQVTAVAFSPDGKTLASAGGDAVRLWDVATGTVARKLDHTANADKLAFSPDGTTLAVAEDTVRLWTIATGTVTQELKGHTDSIQSIAFSPDGTSFATGSWDRSVRLWNVATGVEILRLGHPSPVTSLSFSPDGKTLATGSWDPSLRFWSLATGKQTGELTASTSVVVSVAFSPDGKTLASEGDQYPGDTVSHRVRLWDLTTGSVIRAFEGFRDPPWLANAFSPDGKTFASGAVDLRLWDVATGIETRRFGRDMSNPQSVAFSPDGNTLASAHGDSTVRLWNATAGTPMRVLRGHGELASSVAFLPDGQTLVSGSYDHTLRLWNAAAGTEMRVFRGHTEQVLAVASSPDGTCVASASADRTARLWDVAAGIELRQLLGHTKAVKSVAFSPDGKSLASASYDDTVRLWDREKGIETRKLEGGFAVAFSPDGTAVSWGASEEGVELLNLETGLERGTLKGHTAGTMGVAFSPSGGALATASLGQVSYANTVHLWDVATGIETRALEGHTQQVTTVAFSPAGKLLASSSSDGSIRLWTASGEPLVALRATAGGSGGIAFTSGDMPQVEFLGPEAARTADDLTCRIGPLSFPFDLCRERAVVHGLLASALAGESFHAMP